MGIFKRIFELFNEETANIPANTITKFRKWCDEKDCYMDSTKSVKEFSSQQENSAEVEKYLLSVLTIRS